MDSRSRRGGALVIALITVTVVAALGAGLVHVASSQLRRHTMSVETKRALYVAEAGLAEAWFAIDQGKSGNVGTSTQPASFEDGCYWVEAEWLESDLISLRSTGLVGGGRFALESVVRRPSNPFADLGVFGDASVELRKQSVVDAWDTAKGEYRTYDLRADDEQVDVHVRSNGDLTAKGVTTDPHTRTKILGDATPGPDGILTLGAGVLVTGATAPGVEAASIPEVEVPELPLGGPAVYHGSRTLSSAALGYESLHVGAGATLTLQGPLELVVGQLGADPGGGLLIDTTDGPVAIYVTGPVHLPAGTGLETVGGTAADAALFLLEGGAPATAGGLTAPVGSLPTLDFAPEGEFQGLLIAPHAHLVIPASLRVFGALVAGELEVAASAHVTFDVTSRRNPLGTEVHPPFVSWRVTDLPDVALVRRRIDPVAQLQLAGVEPLPSTAAHWENEIDLVYLDQDATLQSYSGPADSFDWSQVSRVFAQTWTDSPAPVDGLEDLPFDDLLEGDSTSSKAKLLEMSPLSSSELYQAIVADPPLDSCDLRDVLVANVPIAPHVVLKATDGERSPLSSEHLRDVLVASVPLEGSVMLRLLDLPQMTERHVREVREAQAAAERHGKRHGKGHGRGHGWGHRKGHQKGHGKH